MEIPRGDDHCVVFSDPDSAFHFASDAAETVVTICTLHHDPVIAEELGYSPEDLTGARSDSLPDLLFGDNLLLTRLFQTSL